MNVEYINPFIAASTHIITETTGLTPTLGQVFIKNTPYKGGNVLVLIGLTGEIYGSVVITFSEKMANRIASTMMGSPVTELTEISKSAVGELCNMILGNAATLFSQKKKNIDITPPTILTGDNIKISPHKNIIVCIPLKFEGGEVIEIDISYIER